MLPVRQPPQPKPTATSTATTTARPSGTAQSGTTQQPAATQSTPAPSRTGRAGGAAGDASTFDTKAGTGTQPPLLPPAVPETPGTDGTGGTGGTGGTEAPPAWSFSSTINDGRAKSTRDALQKLAAKDPKNAERLTPAVIDALVSGVATPRTQSKIGQEGVLGRRQAMDAAQTLLSLPQPAFDRVSTVLNAAGLQQDGTPAPGASPDTERALILKAVGAREAYLANDGAQEQALAEVEWFAGEIRGQARDSVISQTTVIDVNDQVNTSQANPLDSTVTNDTRADNDGYAQRFTASCAPAVAAMVRGEADPVFALMLGRNGLQNADPNAEASQLEKQVLERDRFFDDKSPEVQLTPEQLDEFQKTGKLPPGVEHLRGSAVSRVGQQARKVMDEKLDEAVTAGKVTKDQAEALRKDTQGGTLTETETAARDVALQAVRDANGNHPTDFELQAMRGDKPREDFMLLAHALRDLAQDVTHNEYWDFNAGASLDKNQLDGVERLLSGGTDVPLRLSTPGQDGGHFIMLTDVRNQEGERQFMASDPWSGRTAWLKESDLTNPKSDWPRREFNVFWQQVTDIFAPLDFVKPPEEGQ